VSAGFVPVLHGDAAIDAETGSSILSTDTILEVFPSCSLAYTYNCNNNQLRPHLRFNFCVRTASYCHFLRLPTSTGVNAAGVQTPHYLTCMGPSMCWSCAIIPTQSRIQCTVFVNIIDFVVSAVIEQVYSNIALQEICPLKCFIFTSKCTKMHLAAGFRPNPLGELTALPIPPS